MNVAWHTARIAGGSVMDASIRALSNVSLSPRVWQQRKRVARRRIIVAPRFKHQAVANISGMRGTRQPQATHKHRALA